MQSYRWQLFEKHEKTATEAFFASIQAKLNDYPAANHYGFISPLLDNFFTENDYVFAALYVDDTAEFIFPVVKYRCQKFFIAWWEIGFPFHSHVNLMQVPALLQEGGEVCNALLQLLKVRFSGWSRFVLRHIQTEQVASEDAGDVAWFNTAGSNINEIVSKKHLRNVQRLGNRLKETGQELRFVFDGRDLSAALDAFAQLELNSWKGEDGVAILNNAATKNFYRELSLTGLPGHMRVACLYAGETLIAGTVGFICGPTLFVHKISYHNDYAEYAPGNLLVLQLLQMALADNALNTVNFVTRPGWINRWHPQISHLYNLVHYPASARGWVLKHLVFKWRSIKPKLKKLLRVNA